jgi:hypothetical protein
MADIAKRCKAGVDEFKKYARDVDKFAAKKKDELDAIKRKYLKLGVDKKQKTKAPSICHDLCVKLVEEIRKTVKEDVDKTCESCDLAIGKLDGSLDKLTIRIKNYDQLIATILHDLKHALEQESPMMENAFQQVLENL